MYSRLDVLLVYVKKKSLFLVSWTQKFENLNEFG